MRSEGGGAEEKSEVRVEGKDGRGVRHIYLGGGHESFDCAVMEVSAYMVSRQSAKTSAPPPLVYMSHVC